MFQADVITRFTNLGNWHAVEESNFAKKVWNLICSQNPAYKVVVPKGIEPSHSVLKGQFPAIGSRHLVRVFPRLSHSTDPIYLAPGAGLEPARP